MRRDEKRRRLDEMEGEEEWEVGEAFFTYRVWKIEGYRGSNMVEKGHERAGKLIL